MKIILISTNTFPSDQGLRTLSGCLKRDGHTVNMLFLPYGESDYSKIYPSEIMKQIDAECEGAGLIGISGMESTSKRCIQIIKYFEAKDIPVAWGGPHTTFFPQRCFRDCNIICVGEAEDAFVELARRIEKKQDYTNINNLWVRFKGKEHINPVGKPVHDLDLLPQPDFDLHDHKILEQGKLIPFEEHHIGGMIFFQTERGCPQACSYCTNNILREIYKGKSDLLRTHSVDYVIKFLKSIQARFPSVTTIDIRDETFLIRPLPWIEEFSIKYKKEIGMRFKCLAEPASMGIENLSDRKMELLVDAGLTDIIVGIQSGSDQLNFKLYNRFISRKQVLAAAKILNKFKDRLTVMYDIISCNPYETAEDILQTIDLVMQLPKPFYLSVNNLVFFEGTPLYKKAVADGYIKGEKDTAGELNYWDRWKHIKLKKKNAYLNLVLNLMRGPCTDRRYGILPASLLKKLISPKVVNFNLKHMVPTYTLGHIVQLADYFREAVAKPVFRMMPVNFKMWYDKVRYKA